MIIIYDIIMIYEIIIHESIEEFLPFLTLLTVRKKRLKQLPTALQIETRNQ